MTLITLTLALALAAEPAPPGRTDRYGDPLPPGAMQRLGTVRFRLSPSNGGYQLLPDGATILTYRGGTVTWRAADTWREKHRWDLPAGLKAESVSADGGRLLTSDAATVQLWDIATRRLVQ